MLFNSIHFLIFFPIVTLLYFAFPRKVRYLWLLLASYYFYMSLDAMYGLFLLASTLVTYGCALLIGKTDRPGMKKLWLTVSLVLSLGALLFFKYFDFAYNNIASLAALFGLTLVKPSFSLLLPVGISFYTFQAIGYNIDVIRGERPAEKNFFKYALYLSFFPLILSGPIERSKNLLVQIQNGTSFDYDNMRKGLMLMLWGLIQKTVITDRLATLVDTVFNNYTAYTGFTVAFAAVMYSLQIYCDFAGYSNIAIGAAQVLGFKINRNFDAPYFAVSIADFWRRWHISLSSWFRDYLYIPMGGSRKGELRKYLNLMAVFLVSGLWHGADWSFVIWGALHGVYQILGGLLQPLKDKYTDTFGVDRKAFSHKLLSALFTFALVTFAWIFFRASDTVSAFGVIAQMFAEFNPWVLTDGSLFTLGLNAANMRLLFLFLGITLLIDAMQCRFDVRDKLIQQGIWLRWIIYIAAILSILIFAVYGGEQTAASFLYFQF